MDCSSYATKELKDVLKMMYVQIIVTYVATSC